MRWVERGAAAAVGLAMAIAAGLFCLFATALSSCEGAQEASDSWICEGLWRALLGPMEVALVIGAFLGPLIGGGVAAVNRRWEALGVGGAVAMVCVFLVLLLTGAQETVVG